MLLGNTMKIKIIIHVLSFALFATFLMSCASDEDGDLTTEEALIGIWRRTDINETLKAREFLSDGTGYLGNFDTGPYTRASSFIWSVSNNTIVLTLSFDSSVVYEEILQLSNGVLVIKRIDTNEIRNFEFIQ